MPTCRALALAVVTIATLTRHAAADDARAEFRIDGRPNVGMPFSLDLVVEGFEEDPAPDQPRLELANATVTPLGVTPNVSQSIQISGGQRTVRTRVTWSMRWQVVVSKEGPLQVPATTVVQGSRRATAAAGNLEVAIVPIAPDMKISLELPTRPVFVGETVPVTVVWLFQRSPQSQTFSIPLLASDAFTASAPPKPPERGRALTLSAGTKELQLGYDVTEVTVAGAKSNRLTTTFFIAPRTVGKIEIAPTSIIAALPVGRADFFGNAPSRLFRAIDVPRTLDVKALPETDRPPTFAGAVGDQFSIEVRASRSVVSLGEPVELDVKIKSNQPLDTLSLGRLDGEGRLPRDRFTVPADPPTGELSDDGKTKTFKITAQVTGPATEVPALAFSYFDASRGVYQTIHSEPIALSVKGGTLISAGDVVAATPSARGPAAPAPDSGALVNADLALSSLGAVDDRPVGGTALWILIGLLYAIPLAIYGARSWQLRTRGQREEAAEVRAARRAVEALLDRAGEAPARELVGPLAAALRELARVLGRDLDDRGLLARLETEGFAPGAASLPLSSDLRSDAAGLLRRWLGEARKAPRASTSAAAGLILIALVGGPAEAAALDEGRLAYEQAMEMTTDATARKAAFSRAAIALGAAVAANPGRPELLTDWGNAALGAGDIATATLAFRRALAIDGGTSRARHNLSWLRSRQADQFRPSTGGATDSLLFFHPWPGTRKLLVGGVAFAAAVLLLVPWSGRRRRVLTGLAAAPVMIWIAMVTSFVLADDHADDAIVMDDVVIRAADSAGAPAALSMPLPRGIEVTVLERRDAWTRIRIANGTTGWIPGGTVQAIQPRP